MVEFLIAVSGQEPISNFDYKIKRSAPLCQIAVRLTLDDCVHHAEISEHRILRLDNKRVKIVYQSVR